ncbi:MAG: S8 family serine peptidase [Planctomycetota bacterium]|nr:S8 family serine peptidase [Planctomycetota bacterium]
MIHRFVGRIATPTAVAALALLGAAWTSANAAPLADQPVISFRSGAVQTPRMNEAQIAGAFAALSAQQRQVGADAPAPRRLVVSFDSPVSDPDRAALAAQGLRLLTPLGGNAFFASLDPAVLDAGALAAHPDIAFVAPIQRQWKQHPDVIAGVLHSWALINPGQDKTANEPPVVALYVMFHQDADIDAEGLAALQRHGAEVRSIVDPINMAVVHIPAENIKGLSDEDAVMWVEPPLPMLSELNAENRARTGADLAAAAPYNLNGAGVTVFVYDGGTIRTTHQDFQGRATNIDTDAVSGHATHVSGTIGGAGIADANERGMAPGVTLVNAGFEGDGSNGFLYTDPGDILADYTLAINTWGADISNNSIGNNTEPNGFPCAWQGDYGATEVLIDSIARGSIGAPFRIVWAAGNERQGSRCDVEGFGDYYSSGPPANAKNQISVGALNSNDDSMTTFSSWGPSDDGRMRPDIAAPGCESGGDGGVRSCTSSSDTAYSTLCGTSMASPTVCGLSALIIQEYRRLNPSLPDMLPSTLKVLWMHTAVDILNPGPDYQTGYGSVRVIPALDHLRSGNYTTGSVNQNGSVGVVVVVQPGDPQLKITIAWDDPPATPNVNPTLVNNLDLVVRSPSGVRHYPWTLDPAAPSANAVRTQPNTRDNNEQVFVQNPEPGTWSVEVVGTSVPIGPQVFSLAASPFLRNCADQGIASLDQSIYNCSDSAILRVGDCGLNTSDSIIETVEAHIASTSDPVGFTVTLTEIGDAAADFRVTVPLATAATPGALLVAPGDTITLTYQDADTGAGSPGVATATATVDCTAPVISGVAVSNIQPRSATVTFATNEPATARLRWGTACGSLTNTLSSTTVGVTHTFNITGLTDQTVYFFSVEATDSAGNIALSDNAGNCYSFETPDIPDFFTQLFTGTADPNDLDNRKILFTPGGSNPAQFYVACSETISVLPVDPGAGTPVTLPDNNPALRIDLAGGQTVKLYGVEYPTVWVNPNGHLTFNGEDASGTESITNHFSRPRISALYDELGPHLAGSQVTWQQLADSLVISFVNVREDVTGGGNNTFQYQLYFDGRIQLSYLSISILDGLAGLSRGTGQPADFTESDLSTYGACGPQPPIAVGQALATPSRQPLQITLNAVDDGLPFPSQLSFIVDSLPTNGKLFETGGNPIINVPHVISRSANQLRYEPACSFGGADSFTFRASDQGVPPQGGLSNQALVSITVGGRTPIHQWLTDDTNPGWATTGSWAFGRPLGQGGSTGGGSGSPDPAAGFTGTNVYGFNLAGNYTNSMPEYTLTSTPFSMTGQTGSFVTFRRWLGVERSRYDFATFQISTNGGSSWTTVWTNSFDTSLNDGGWTLQSFDIASIVDNQPSVQFRWTMGPTDGSVIYCGWNLDDIVVSAYIPLQPCLSDFNDDCRVDFGDITKVLEGWGTYNFNDITLILTNWQTTCN